MKIIKKHRKLGKIVFDPFCGRGTTIYAARKLGTPSFGFDTSPIAAAVAQAKLAKSTVDEVLALGEKLIGRTPKEIPETSFFKQAFSERALYQICSLREGLIANKALCDTTAILRAVALGCLHGPMIKSSATPSYFSNQMPRTFASKPDYSVRFWDNRNLLPPDLSIIDVIKKKLSRISDLNTDPHGNPKDVKCADSRWISNFSDIPKPGLIITSPPYYGMRTYVQDQWLRMWFLGGPEKIEYENEKQVCHSSQDEFTSDLAKVWKNIHQSSDDDAHLYVRFGAIPSVKCNAKRLLIESLNEAGGWSIVSVRNAKTSNAGKRQADQMGGKKSAPQEEFDFHAVRC